MLFYAGAADARTADAGRVALAFNVKTLSLVVLTPNVP